MLNVVFIETRNDSAHFYMQNGDGEGGISLSFLSCTTSLMRVFMGIICLEFQMLLISLILIFVHVHVTSNNTDFFLDQYICDIQCSVCNIHNSHNYLKCPSVFSCFQVRNNTKY